MTHDFQQQFRKAVYGDLRAAWRSGFITGFLLGGTLMVVCLLLFGCALPTEPRATDGCPEFQEFCAGKALAPLGRDAVRDWQERANAFVDDAYGPGKDAYPSVVWHPCYFVVSGICAAGWNESRDIIHVSTAEATRTGPLVAHETIHAIYRVRFGDPDADHKRQYGW